MSKVFGPIDFIFVVELVDIYDIKTIVIHILIAYLRRSRSCAEKVVEVSM